MHSWTENHERCTYGVIRFATPDDLPETSETTTTPLEDAASKSSVRDTKLAGRKNRLNVGYRITSKVYLVASIVHLVRRGFHPWSLYFTFGGGTFTMAILLYILKGAAAHDRLSSDTYKRLNLSVVAYSTVQLLMPFTSRVEDLFLKGPALLALVNGVKGYSYGVLGWDKSKSIGSMRVDIKAGFLSSIMGLQTVKQQSIGYLVGILFLAAMSNAKLLELCKILVVPSEEGVSKSVMILSRVSRLARLGLMTSIVYTLKDAADRGRLGGTTFVQLNYVMAAAFLSMSFYLSQVGPTPFGVLSGGLFVLTLFNGVTNARKK